MRHIKLFEELTYMRDGKIISKVYHVSAEPISHLDDTPMWFALERDHSEQWFTNTLDAHGQAYQYEATIMGKVAHINDQTIQEMFARSGLDPIEWEDEIVGNPDRETVMALRGTSLLISGGYSGLIYSDYDPRDWNEDLDALIIFRPATAVKGFKLIKEE